MSPFTTLLSNVKRNDGNNTQFKLRLNSTEVMLSYTQTCMEVDFTFYGYIIILFFLCPLFPSLFTEGISYEDSNIIFLILISRLIM